MKAPTLLLQLTIALLLTASVQAQQSPSPQPTQIQAAPCASKPAASTQATGPVFKTPNKWKQMLDQQRQKLAQTTGVSLPDPTKAVEQAANSKPAPCPPRAATPAPAPVTTQTVTVKLPPDSFVTLRCNSKILDPRAVPPQPGLGGLAAAFAAMAIPRANEFEVDKVEIDDSVKTPCYRVKFDPNTGKQFVPQQ